MTDKTVEDKYICYILRCGNYTYNGCVNYEGIPNGKGEWSQPNGLKYDGMFKDYKFHGYGVLTSPDGKVLNAIEYLSTSSALGAEAWTR